ncbi:MAG: holdfast anchoring protein HfaA [Pseudomonadota bacterium]
MPRRNLLFTAALLPALLAGSALAQSGSVSEWSQPYGYQPGSQNQPYAGSRDRNGNRLVINGLIQNSGVGGYVQGQGQTGFSGVGAANGGFGYGPNSALAFSQSTAIANQLNVIVNGHNNTVVVNANQTNTGTVTAGSTAGAQTSEATAQEQTNAGG